ncbi:MAG: hypothetical protein ACRDL5_11915 [Solirubrobacteraceae bacterium]
MSFVHLATTVSLPASTAGFAPLAVGFFGLGTGYFIYGPQELFGFPKRDKKVDVATGLWGVWMPGFMQFFTGIYLFAGLVLFGTLSAKPLYVAGLAFTAYGIHWFAIGMNRALGADSRPNAFMSITFTLISILGVFVFFKAPEAVGGGSADWPVGLLFIGLSLIYISDFFASLGSSTGLKALGFWHLLTGAWLMYLTWSTALDFALGYHLPL